MTDTRASKPSFIAMPEVTRRTGFKRERIRQLEAMGKFPKRIALSARRNVWIEGEVDAWVAARISERTNESINTQHRIDKAKLMRG